MRNVGLPYDFLNPYKKPPITSRRFLTFHGDYRFLSETMTATSTPNDARSDHNAVRGLTTGLFMFPKKSHPEEWLNLISGNNCIIDKQIYHDFLISPLILQVTVCFPAK